MAQTIPQQLAAHIDEICGLHNTGGVAQFFDERGNIRACQPGENVFEFWVASAIAIYDVDEHDIYKINVLKNFSHNHWLDNSSSVLQEIKEAINQFNMPKFDIRAMDIIYELTENITFQHLYTAMGEHFDYQDNISVYDAEANEYYPVSVIARATENNDVLDNGHLILVIEK